MRRKAVQVKVKEAIMRLKNKNKTIRDIGQTLGLPESTVCNIIKKKECSGELCNRKGTDEVAKQLSSKVRVLCWVMTSPQSLKTRAQHIRATWAKHCNMVFYMSSEATDFPTVGLNVSEGRDQLYWKTIQALQYLHTHHLYTADWFLKADDDTFVVVENLRRFLHKHNPEEPVYFGHRFRFFIKQGYMSGGAGYVLSREALRRFVQGFSSGQCTHSSPVEDMALGRCMETMEVKGGDSRDEKERETFNPFDPAKHLLPPASGKQFWGYSFYPTKRGPDCCSDYAITFHYIKPAQMYELEYYTFHLRPYGYKYRFNPAITSNITEDFSVSTGFTRPQPQNKLEMNRVAQWFGKMKVKSTKAQQKHFC